MGSGSPAVIGGRSASSSELCPAAAGAMVRDGHFPPPCSTPWALRRPKQLLVQICPCWVVASDGQMHECERPRRAPEALSVTSNWRSLWGFPGWAKASPGVRAPGLKSGVRGEPLPQCLHQGGGVGKSIYHRREEETAPGRLRGREEPGGRPAGGHSALVLIPGPS